MSANFAVARMVWQPPAMITINPAPRAGGIIGQVADRDGIADGALRADAPSARRRVRVIAGRGG